MKKIKRDESEKTKMEINADESAVDFIYLLREAEAEVDKIHHPKRDDFTEGDNPERMRWYGLTDTDKLTIDKALAALSYLYKRGQDAMLQHYFPMENKGCFETGENFDRSDFLDRMDNTLQEISIINTTFRKWQEKTQL